MLNHPLVEMAMPMVALHIICLAKLAMVAKHISHLARMAVPLVEMHITHYHLCSHPDSEHAQDVTERLITGVFSVAELFGIRNVFVAMPVVNRYMTMRLLTGSILAHEMMHAWLRLKGYRTLSPDIEEGICQVLAHLWIESEIMAGSGSSAASSSSGSSSSTSSKKGGWSQLEHKLGDFFQASERDGYFHGLRRSLFLYT